MKREKKRMLFASAGVALFASCAALLMQEHVAQTSNVLKVEAKEKNNYEDYTCNLDDVKSYKFSQIRTYGIVESDDFVVGDANQEKEEISEFNCSKNSRMIKNKSWLDIIIAIEKAEITSIKNVKTNAVKLKWKKISGVTGYEIYRAKGHAGKYKKIKTITGANIVSYKNKNLSENSYYYYKVRAYKIVKGKTFYGEYSSYAYAYIAK